MHALTHRDYEAQDRQAVHPQSVELGACHKIFSGAVRIHRLVVDFHICDIRLFRGGHVLFDSGVPAVGSTSSCGLILNGSIKTRSVSVSKGEDTRISRRIIRKNMMATRVCTVTRGSRATDNRCLKSFR
jgi:hypothetical protein